MMENDIFDAILNGNIAYELCRPINIYRMWFARSLANRFAKALLRCLPILLTAMLLPAPYGLMMPVNPEAFLLFFLTLLLGTGVTVSFCMLIYMTTFFTISPMGIPFSLTRSGMFWSCCPLLPCRTSLLGSTAETLQALVCGRPFSYRSSGLRRLHWPGNF